MTNEKRTLSEKMDYFFNKVVPKKFLVFVVATVLAVWGLAAGKPWLSGEQWSYIAIAYLGSNAVLGTGRGIADAMKKPPSGG